MPSGSNQPAIELNGVSKRFQRRERTNLPGLNDRDSVDTFLALRDVTFSISAGETVALVGRNGSGKSTILQLIAGLMLPTSGEVTVRGRISPLLQLGAGFQPNLSGRENIYLNASILGLPTRTIRQRFDEIVAWAELEEFMDTPLRHYSSGMHARLGFAVAVHCEPDILLLDEVLAVGDATFRAKCEERMAKFAEEGVTMLIVSHSMEFVAESCPRALLIQKGHLLDDGPSEDVVKRYNQMNEPLRPGNARAPFLKERVGRR